MTPTKILLLAGLAASVAVACSSNNGSPPVESGSGGSTGAASGTMSGASAGATGATSGARSGSASGSGSGAPSGASGAASGASGASAGSSSGAAGSSSGASGSTGSGTGSGVAEGGAPDAGTIPCITPTTPQSCSAPVGTNLPICKLSQTGCFDPKTPTSFASNAVYYEVNTPLWSDDAAKTRAFVLPTGGKIHVKNCDGDAGMSAECVSPMGNPAGRADDGRWLFPVGTVLIKNFLFDGKLVETRLLMHVDTATAALIADGFGSVWVGYNYQWNEAQTDATIVPNARTPISFNTGQRTVDWVYPSFGDCIGCHSPAVATLGPETAQMNRTVNGANQIDTFIGMGLFDSTAPTKPYAGPMVEPYQNTALGLTHPTAGATVDQMARSYLSANCGFCHRPDVNDQGFDLRYSLSLHDTHICNLMPQNGIPGMTTTYADLVPGNHAASNMWIRMNIAVPFATDATQMIDYGRMPSVGTLAVDPQALSLIGSWIDSITTCP
jgi:cytochrome c551/c552